MSLTHRLGRIEKHVSGLTATASRRGKVIILRSLGHAPDATLIGYRDGSGNLLPLNHSQWPHVPAGTVKVVSQVWSDDAVSDLLNSNTNSEHKRNSCDSHSESDSSRRR